MGKRVTLEGDIKQGKALVDQPIKAGVRPFVYSSIDRGGEARSWENPTNIPHSKTKHQIEQHLRDATEGGMSNIGWTILRPSIFMDNLMPGFAGKVFMTTLRDTMKDKPLQWVAAADIGVFAAMAFEQSESLAGDILTLEQLDRKFETVTVSPVGTTFGLLGRALKHGVAEVGTMVQRFADEGYRADMPMLGKENPAMIDLETWLTTRSQFEKKV